jgi:hypothetical protein
MSKYYFSRAQTRVWSSEYPVGDPTGGAAYGEKNDPVTAIVGSAVVGGLLSLKGVRRRCRHRSASIAGSIRRVHRRAAPTIRH